MAGGTWKRRDMRLSHAQRGARQGVASRSGVARHAPCEADTVSFFNGQCAGDGRQTVNNHDKCFGPFRAMLVVVAFALCGMPALADSSAAAAADSVSVGG